MVYICCPLKITQHTAINVWTAGHKSEYTPEWKLSLQHFIIFVFILFY